MSNTVLLKLSPLTKHQKEFLRAHILRQRISAELRPSSLRLAPQRPSIGSMHGISISVYLTFLCFLRPLSQYVSTQKAQEGEVYRSGCIPCIDSILEKCRALWGEPERGWLRMTAHMRYYSSGPAEPLQGEVVAGLR